MDKNFKTKREKSGDGGWGLGVGGWGLGPNPKSPIPNPQSPIIIYCSISLNILVSYLNFKFISKKISKKIWKKKELYQNIHIVL